MENKKVKIYDENGISNLSVPWEEAIDKNLCRGVVRVFIINSKGYVFIQKREENKKIAPGLWDNSAGGHIDEGEEPKEAALRELKEEIGIELNDLQFITSYSFDEKQGEKIFPSFNFLFMGKSDNDVNIQKEELSDGKWVAIEELKSSINKSPEKFAPGLKRAFPSFLSKIEKSLPIK